MIKISEIFKKLESDIINEQRKISINSPLNVFYGVNGNKQFRLSFLSTTPPYELESTKEIKVTQGKESGNVYWTCFDLLNEDAKDVFFSFCESLIESVNNESEETIAMNKLKNRYYAWKLLLKNKGKMPYEMYQGLYGELYFLSEILSKKCTIDDAVIAWVGPDNYSKDFSINNDWYEVKTIGASSSTVKINSLAQLDSDISGHLVVVVVERMSDQFTSELSSVHDLYTSILKRIINPMLKEEFINKLLKYGYVDDDQLLNNHKYEVKKVSVYKVESDFPKLTRNIINNVAISNVTYELLINAIDKFLED